MKLNENTLTILNIIITASIALITTLLTSRYTSKPEKQKTARFMFDNCYSPIYSLVEYKLFSKDITIEEVQEIGYDIIKICNSANNYYFPSIKIYAERLANSNVGNYNKNWDYFCSRFSMRYDSVCRMIGLPIRNSAYRLNRQHFISNWHFARLFAKNNWLTLLYCMLLIILSGYLCYINFANHT
ncbi:hypothetical protein IA929_05130 [Listeria seeligeri]|uniref:hypothetical protein n=1 Tax=Listeria seeligeri TaxID=1640 RepID=UPI0018888444|nr:hypothetical protein [Listeria seeligeri]MBF2599383.1 hypothetical protein [Listeria seeligeri]